MALTQDQVIDAAVALLRKHGLGDLTMRRLARELEEFIVNPETFEVTELRTAGF